MKPWILLCVSLLAACGDSSGTNEPKPSEQQPPGGSEKPPTLTQIKLPVINTVDDQKASQGEIYHYQPTLQEDTQALWVKTFGPDNIQVNPSSGEVTWNIPGDLPSESFHIGVKASNEKGVAQDSWVVTVGEGRVVYVGPEETFTTLKEAMADIESGDTIIMRNGYWNHNNGANTIPGNRGKSQNLPGGTSDAFTTLMGEDPGEVIIDGNNEVSPISLFGSTKHPDHELNNNGWDESSDYIAIKGLVLINSDREALRVDFSKFVKLINIGVGPSGFESSAYSNLYVHQSQYVLMEGIYAWGHGRYKLQFQKSSNSVVRRSIARIDDYAGGKPIGGFISYCSKNIMFQNNILVDSDHSTYWNDHTEIINAFGVPATNCIDYPEFNEFHRSLALNVHMGLMNTDARTNVNPTLWQDIVGWDLYLARHHNGESSATPILSGVGASISNRLTIGEVSTEGDYLFYSRQLDSEIKNSTLVNADNKDDSQAALARQGSGGDMTFDYINLNDFAGDDSDGSRLALQTNGLDSDPKFRYITMLPRDSQLRTAGENGSSVGAELMTMLGQSGTFYGQDGFNIETGIPMWPMPNEALAHKHFKTNHVVGIDREGKSAGVPGNRGFAVDDQTLTNYVWGYLGTPVPPFNAQAVKQGDDVLIYWSDSAPIEQGLIEAYKIYQVINGQLTLLEEVSDESRHYKTTGDMGSEFVITAVHHSGDESDYSYIAKVE